MNFTQLEFPLLLLLVTIAYWTLPTHGLRKTMLLCTSCYFYAYWDYRFFGLLFASTLWDWSLGGLMMQQQSPQMRRGLLILSLAGNLGLLGFFKYYNFFIDSVSPLFERWGWHAQTLTIILPIGISFYTFQTMSYTIDIYRGHLRARRSLLDFALYVSFFPQLVAGPIVRAGDFFPQLEHRMQWSTDRFYAGCQQLLRGYLKKLLIADQLARLSDTVFAYPDAFSTLTMLLGLLAWTGQIYADFSGYSDIAIGAGKLLGIELPENFQHPYLSTSIQDFWRRWHMSLSTWLRDYLYIPLGGNRGGATRTYFNLMVTMTLGGLWHGAAWTFVLWGLWHGACLSVNRLWFQHWQRKGSFSPLPAWLSWLLTFAAVVFGWSLFRAGSMEQWLHFWRSCFGQRGTIHWLPPQVLIAFLALIVEHIVWSTRFRSCLELPRDRWYAPILTGLAIWALCLFAMNDFRPFVYFQF